jgi:hypothetical protein
VCLVYGQLIVCCEFGDGDGTWAWNWRLEEYGYTRFLCLYRLIVDGDLICCVDIVSLIHTITSLHGCLTCFTLFEIPCLIRLLLFITS